MQRTLLNMGPADASYRGMSDMSYGFWQILHAVVFTEDAEGWKKKSVGEKRIPTARRENRQKSRGSNGRDTGQTKNSRSPGIGQLQHGKD